MSDPQVEALTDAQMNAGTEYALKMLEELPKESREVFEAHLTGVLVLFWAALWGTFGTEYAKGFIESQLRGISAGEKPKIH
jgi:hypothetical protein